MAKSGKGQAKKAVIAAVAMATALGGAVSLNPARADAARTYVIGAPDWLTVGDGATSLAADPDIIAAAIGDGSSAPRVGWTWLLPQESGTAAVPFDVGQAQWVSGSSTNWSSFQSTGPEACVGTNPRTCTTPGTVAAASWGRWTMPQQLAQQAAFANWTTYDNAVHLISYGDGAFATGDAYRRYLEAFKQGDIPMGQAVTDGRAMTWNEVRVEQTLDGFFVMRTESGGSGDTGWGIVEYFYLFPDPEDLPEPEQPGEPASSTPGGVLNLTLISMTYLRNPTRPGGGLYTRFGPLYEELTGVSPATPAAEDVVPDDLTAEERDTLEQILLGNYAGLTKSEVSALAQKLDGQHVLLTEKADLTWQYDLLSDAPVTANPIAWANSVAAALAAPAATAALLQLSQNGGAMPGLVSYTGPDGTQYGTLTTGALPLLAPARTVAAAAENVIGRPVNTPVADALEPMLKILTNIGYSDVVTPADLEPGGAHAGSNYTAYDRTLTQAHVPVLFGTQTLTRAERARLPGDLVTALGSGIGAEVDDVLTNSPVAAGQRADLLKALKTPGTAITRAGKGFGDGLTRVLGSLEKRLPAERSPRTQAELAGVQREVGKGLKKIRDEVKGAVAAAKKTLNQTAD